MAKTTNSPNTSQKVPTAPGKGYPAPPQLSTPSRIKPAGVKAITEALNPLVADGFALYIKTKNFHWHLATPHFRDYHLLFDEHASQIFETIDPLAERVRKIGGTTVRSVSHIASLTQIKDENKEFVTADEMVLMLAEDNLALNAAMLKAHKICEENEDVATASILEVFIDEAERRVWFLNQIVPGSKS